MDFEIKKTRQKEERIYKTLYLKGDLWKAIEKIAIENQTRPASTMWLSV